MQQIPNGRLDQHEHPFEVKALVTEGSIVIDGICSVYKPGDIFQLDCGQPHAESYGPQGVKYLASRKQ
ncbi:cupin domain-containing protein [Polynucleobacter necessarius]|uniref:cupin domain-containing protein n=1 Tax=Polynucleobacter necessarius TaxID=576610 RepID=UPI001E5AB72D|nr:cupin [Polynucleobacter necessarius]